LQRDWITSAFPKASFRKCSQVKRKCPLSQHPERPALTNKFGPFDGGLRRSSGRCHFTPVGRSLSKAPLGKQKTGHHPEDTLFGSALPPDIPRVLGELENPRRMGHYRSSGRYSPGGRLLSERVGILPGSDQANAPLDNPIAFITALQIISREKGFWRKSNIRNFSALNATTLAPLRHNPT
jgi:hypothetical protein